MDLPHFPDQNRPDRAVIAMMGDGVLAFLDNLLTCDCAQLAEGAACYGALLNPQGKILHDIFVFNAGDRVLIDCAASQRNALVQRLVIYRLRAKIQIEMDNQLEVAVHHMQPDGPMAYVDPRNAGMGFRRFAPVGSMINVPAPRKYDEARIVCGLADSDDDIGVEQVFPHEANFDQFGAVSFSKGCFVGQEVVSRMQHRGTARSRMLPVFFSGVLDAKQVKSGDKVIGDVLSIAGHHGLALLRIDRLAESSVPLMCGSTAVHVNLPEWIGYDVEIPEVAR